MDTLVNKSVSLNFRIKTPKKRRIYKKLEKRYRIIIDRTDKMEYNDVHKRGMRAVVDIDFVKAS